MGGPHASPVHDDAGFEVAANEPQHPLVPDALLSLPMSEQRHAAEEDAWCLFGVDRVKNALRVA